MIKTGGENVATREVEDVIYKNNCVQEVAVIGVPHTKWVEAVMAVIVPKSGEGITEAEIMTLCKNELAPFKIPKGIVFVDSIPKTPTGKILKRELRKVYSDFFAGT
jgi:fatty-acyl-CoA synthase